MLYADDLAYVHHTGFADLARGAASFLVEELAHARRVVDLGCGSGIVARALVKAGHEVTGVDLSPAMVAIARTQAPAARFVVASLYDVDAWGSVPVDAVLAVGEPLSYLDPRSGRAPALAPFFRRVARALRSGGVFAFDVIVAGSPSLTRRSFVDGDGWTVLADSVDRGARLTRTITTFTRRERGAWSRGDERHLVRVLEVADVKRDLAAAGFSVRVRRSYGEHALAVRRRAFLCRRR